MRDRPTFRVSTRNVVWLVIIVVVGIVVGIAAGPWWGVLAAAGVLVVSEVVERGRRRARRTGSGDLR